jgi:hypothetical protein
MRDLQAHLEKLRTQLAECELIRDLATDDAKRELFTRLAEHFKVLAHQIEAVMAAPPDTFLGRKSYETPQNWMAPDAEAAWSGPCSPSSTMRAKVRPDVLSAGEAS